ncbi:MAG: serine hydrolase, partial [Candidatus Marinimicrobia bacterium]|nr:serine hydrolase [Candidatus Neomarinimicrobiota bacterium]
IINSRAYSDAPPVVAAMGAAFIRGAQAHGIVACAKHYPGHGNTATDSHTSLPVIPGDREALEAMELAPFKAAIEAGVKMIMVGHIAVPGLDPSNRAASQSAMITEELLRGQFGFKGLIVTDGMEMKAITGASWSGEAAIRAIEAGNDMVLLPPYVDQTINAIEQAVLNGRISRERIAQSVRRILQVKEDLGLYAERGRLSREQVRRTVGLSSSNKIARGVMRESITLVKDQPGLIPYHPGRRESYTHILISMDDDLKERTRPFWREVERTIGPKRVRNIFVNEQLAGRRIAELVKEARGSSHTLVTALVRIHMDKGESTIDPSHQSLLDALAKAGVKYTLVTFGSPYLPSLDLVPTYLAGYSYAPGSMLAMADAIFGRAPITGRLPVTLDRRLPRGHGLERSGLTSVFEPAGSPPNLSRAYAVLDSAIEQQITPGAQLFISQYGQVLADTALGYFTYDKAEPVTTKSIYDLASVTKVLVGASVGMKLVEDDYLVLDEPVAHYFPGFTGRWKEQVTVRHLLTHSAGLPAYKQFWTLGIDPQAVLADILATELEYEPGTEYVYSDLGMILYTALAEMTTGRPFEQLAREWVFEPLRMVSTNYNPPAEWLDRIVPTEVYHDFREGLTRGTVHDRNTYFMGGVSAHAGVFAPASELARVGQLYLNGGLIFGTRLVQEQTPAMFIEPQELPPESGRALFWQMASSTAHAGDLLSSAAFGHTGFTGTSLWIDPERELIVVLLTNRVHPSRENSRIKGIRREFHNAVVRSLGASGALTLAGR